MFGYIDKLSIFLRLLTYLVLIYFCLRYITPILFEFLSKRKNKSNTDFDRLVENKKNMLNRGKPLSQKTQRPNKRDKSDNSTYEFYKQEFLKLSSKKNKTDQESKFLLEIKEILELLDSIQWGEHSLLNSIHEKIKRNYRFRVDLKNINSIFKLILKRDILLKLSEESPLRLKKILNLIELLTIQYEISQYNEGFKTYLFKETRTSLKNIENAIKIYIHYQITNIFDYDQKNEVKMIDIKEFDLKIYSFCFNEDRITLKNTKTQLESLFTIIEIMKSVTPLPRPSSKNDTDWAKKVLELNDSHSPDEVKKQFKKLAQIKHPDKLASKGISEKYIPIATENFSLLQKAYDIMKKA